MARQARRWPFKRRLALAAASLLIVIDLSLAAFLNDRLGLIPGPNDYNVVAWEVRNLPNKWLFEFGELFRRDRATEERDADIRRFFDLTRAIQDLERDLTGAAAEEQAGTADGQRLAALRLERNRVENGVEDTIEARVSTVAASEGITRSTLLFGRIVFPPVDFELTESPRSLAVSPRDRIELIETQLLREDLDLQAVESIEEEKLRRENLSALAFPTGGIGAYPTIISYTTSYRDLLEVVAHEWMHNYLALRPLGFNYYDSADLRALNETTADLVGRELAVRVTDRWPLATETPAAPRPQPPAGFDSGAVLRALRSEVDALLAAGEIEPAERRMEEARQQLAAQGVYIRKINQAYFAFTNLYAGEAGSPGATNPIGPKIDELRRLSPSLRDFVDVMGSITSVAALDRALAERR